MGGDYGAKAIRVDGAGKPKCPRGKEALVHGDLSASSAQAGIDVLYPTRMTSGVLFPRNRYTILVHIYVFLSGQPTGRECVPLPA